MTVIGPGLGPQDTAVGRVPLPQNEPVPLQVGGDRLHRLGGSQCLAGARVALEMPGVGSNGGENRNYCGVVRPIGRKAESMRFRKCVLGSLEQVTGAGQ